MRIIATALAVVLALVFGTPIVNGVPSSGVTPPPTETFSLPIPPTMKWTRHNIIVFINRIHDYIVHDGTFHNLSQNDQDSLLFLPHVITDWAKKYPKDPEVPANLYFAGWDLSQLVGGDDGPTLYHFLINNYPKSEWAAKAQTELDNR